MKLSNALTTHNRYVNMNTRPKHLFTITYSLYSVISLSVSIVSCSTRAGSLAASSPRPAAAPAGSSGVCEPGPRWPCRWGRCSSRGRGR